MQFRIGDTAATTGERSAARRGRRRVPATLTTTLAAVSLATALAVPLGTALATAASAAPPPPAPGVAPGAVASDSSHQYLFYTAAGGSVWAENVTNGESTPTAVGGHLVSAPAPFFPGGALGVFGQGTDNQLWDNSCDLFLYGCGSWLPRGGQITSKPGAVNRGSAGYSAYARGTDGAVWARDYSTSSRSWGRWHSLGGRVLPGTGPTASYLNGSTYVMVVGTDHQLYIEQVGVTGFAPAGGRTNASPALAAAPGTAGQPAALVGFAEGTNGVGYYHRFNSSSPGWHSMGGMFTSGLAAADAVQAAIPTTYTFGLGTDGQVYKMTASWASYPPGLGNWVRVTG